MADIVRSTLEDVKIKKDRLVLGTLMARIKELKVTKKAAEDQLPPLVEEATLLLSGHNIKSLSFSGKFFTVVNGTNISYSQRALAEAMMKHNIKADTIAAILDEARSVKSYTSLMMTEPKEYGGQSLK